MNVLPSLTMLHLHADPLADYGSPPPRVCAGDEKILMLGWDPQKPFPGAATKSCRTRVSPSATDEQLRQQTINLLEHYNIRAVTFGPLDIVSKWRAAAPNRIIPAVNFEQGHDAQGGPLYRDPAELRRLFAEGKFAVFAEVSPQYHGLSPADPSQEAYFAWQKNSISPLVSTWGKDLWAGRMPKTLHSIASAWVTLCCWKMCWFGILSFEFT